MKHTIKWVVNPYRQDKRTGPISPVPRTNYMKQLFNEEEARLKRAAGENDGNLSKANNS